MNLIIDIGNSLAKIALFKDGKLKRKEIVGIQDIFDFVTDIKNKYPSIKNAIISSVGKLKKSDFVKLNDLFYLLVLGSETHLPFNNLYDTPKTLGVDRMALVSASVYKFPKNNVLIIDAGTCVTYDFITSNNDYIGGAISPGLQMRYKSLHAFTANLPLLEAEKPNHIIGKSTKGSIHSGVVFGILNEIDGVIDTYKLKYPDLTVILTGGDAIFLSKQLKSSIFALPNFLLEGLNYILQYNTHE
ncbi:type III pantothenate kinase [Litoribaculum gwangyangense]|uniref:Type III pantothenate kinase n=1 Tax=Litoribaculum gwangyangense TaxID=1130722 RepID=A0ABP9CRN0_9FLAO